MARMDSGAAHRSMPTWAVADRTAAGRAAERLGRTAAGPFERIALGEYGFFFHNAGRFADIASVGGRLAIVSGQAFTDGRTLTARDMLERGIAAPSRICGNKYDGNALVVCKDLHGPDLCAFRPLMSGMVLYHHCGPGFMVGSESLRALADFLERPEPDPRAVVLHCIHRFTVGDCSYLKGVRRLCAGESLRWSEGGISVSQQAVLPDGDEPKRRINEATLDMLENRFSGVFRDYATACRQAGFPPTVLLSGGVDSSLLLALLRVGASSGERRLSCSYRANIACLGAEAEYAATAAAELGSEHVFHDIDAGAYTDWLDTWTAMVGRPPGTTQCVFTIPFFDRYASAHGGRGFLMGGLGGDSVGGSGASARAVMADSVRSVPPGLLRAAAGVAGILAPSFAGRLRQAQYLLAQSRSPDTLSHPEYDSLAHSKRPLLESMFSRADIDAAVDVLEDAAAPHANSERIAERLQLFDALSIADDTVTETTQVGLMNGLLVVHPYMDRRLFDAVRLIDPDQRYLWRGHSKPVLRALLARRSNDALAYRPKKDGSFWAEVVRWMKEGRLRDRVMAIERPAFLDRRQFSLVQEQPDALTFSILGYDTWIRQVLRRPGRQ